MDTDSIPNPTPPGPSATPTSQQWDPAPRSLQAKCQPSDTAPTPSTGRFSCLERVLRARRINEPPQIRGHTILHKRLPGDRNLWLFRFPVCVAGTHGTSKALENQVLGTCASPPDGHTSYVSERSSAPDTNKLGAELLGARHCAMVALGKADNPSSSGSHSSVTPTRP